MSSSKSRHVVVVGAGLAGLGAATRLARQGCEVTLLEKSQIVGGRRSGETIDGFSIEPSLPLMSSVDRHMLQWITEAGLGNEMLPLRWLQLTQLHRGRVHPIDTESISGISAIPGVALGDKWHLLRLSRLMNRYRPLLDPEHPERASSLDFRSAADFGRLYFGQSLWERWISPAAASTFMTDPEEISRVAFLLGWMAAGEGRATHGLLRRGFHDLMVHVGARLRGVHLGAEVVGIEPGADGGYTVECTVEGVADTTRSLEADAVVIATPPAEAERITQNVITLGEKDFFGHVQTGPLVTLSVALDHAPMGGPQLVRVPQAESLPIESYVIEPGCAQGRVPEDKGLISLTATQDFAFANAGATDEVVEKSLLGALGRLHPRETRSVAFTRLHRMDDAMSLFHVRIYRELDRFQRIQRDRAAAGRRLYFAGDYLSGPSVENALVSGQRVANELLGDLAG